MQFTTHNQEDIYIGETHGLGAISVSYEKLVSTFGQPMQKGYDDYKVDAEWRIKFADNTLVTIYNWKNGRNYLGDHAPAVEQIKTWNIGGRDSKALHVIKSELNLATR